MYSTMIDRAIGFASREHEGQYRKSVGVPYIAHPMGVATILLQMGCRQEVVAAALLHDTVEDTDVTIQEICERFGQEVADIVAGCTELPQKYFNWEERKLDMIGKLRNASLEVKLVAAADKYHNLRHISKSKKKCGSAVWKQFGRGPERQAWYYRTIYNSILENLPECGAKYPVFTQLAAVIEELFNETVSCPPQS
jgi:(p)ppGpp synthase/HD superfamily hydrolase